MSDTGESISHEVEIAANAAIETLIPAKSRIIFKKCVCLRPHGRSVNFYGNRNRFEV